MGREARMRVSEYAEVRRAALLEATTLLGTREAVARELGVSRQAVSQAMTEPQTVKEN